MIELNVKDYCQECDRFEPDVYKNGLLAGELRYSYRTVISCKNRAICAAIQKHLEDQMKQNSQENSQEKQTS